MAAPIAQTMNLTIDDNYFNPNPKVVPAPDVLANNAPNLNQAPITEKNIKKGSCNLETATKCCECFAKGVAQCVSVTSKAASICFICCLR